MTVTNLQILCITIILVLITPVPMFGLRQPDVASNNEADTSFNRGLETFGISLFYELAKTNRQKNIVFSPFSIQTCIAMARMGAEHETAVEMDQVLALAAQKTDNLASNYHSILAQYENSAILKIANKIYIMVGHEVQDEFNEMLTKKFFSSVDVINFAQSAAAAQTINSWVESKTNNLIKNLIAPQALDVNTRMVLVNAIHFKGEWVHPFRESSTRKNDFYLDETTAVKVEMMHTVHNFRYGEFPELDATALEMPYKDSDLSMLIVLPNSRTGLVDLEEKLKNVTLTDLTRRMFSTKVIVDMPKFKAEFEVELTNVLKNLGLKRMFSGNAEFSKMLKSPEPLQVSAVVHKAFIEVNEKGTEAAAATGKFFEILWIFLFTGYCCIQAANHKDTIFFPDDPILVALENENNKIVINKPSPDAVNNALESFGKRLYTELAHQVSQNRNIIFSPFSIETGIAMLRMGAEYQTATEIDRALGFHNQESDQLANNFHTLLSQYENDPHLKIANKIYLKPGSKIRRKFYNTLARDFFSSAGGLNFADQRRAARIINNWVTKKTNRKINNLISPSLLNNKTNLVLVNALHFNGQWANQFKEKSTYETNFYLDERNTVPVQMMVKSAYFSYGDFADLDATAVELPYANSNISMLIILPNSRQGLKPLEEKLKTIPLSYFTESMVWEKIVVRLPKFRVESEFELSTALRNLGMQRMFTDEAQFGKIANRGLKVSAIVQKTYIEVNEYGSEAAAATAIYLPTLLSASYADFTADRPFLFYIKNSKNLVLFTGNVHSF